MSMVNVNVEWEREWEHLFVECKCFALNVNYE